MYCEAFEKENGPSTFEGNVKTAWETISKFFNFGEGSNVYEGHSFEGEGVTYFAKFKSYVSLFYNSFGNEGRWSAQIQLNDFFASAEEDTPEKAIIECLEDIVFSLERRIQNSELKIKQDRMAIESIRDQIGKIPYGL